MAARSYGTMQSDRRVYLYALTIWLAHPVACDAARARGDGRGDGRPRQRGSDDAATAAGKAAAAVGARTAGGTGTGAKGGPGAKTANARWSRSSVSSSAVCAGVASGSGTEACPVAGGAGADAGGNAEGAEPAGVANDGPAADDSFCDANKCI